jgi:hypothetical protein
VTRFGERWPAGRRVYSDRFAGGHRQRTSRRGGTCRLHNPPRRPRSATCTGHATTISWRRRGALRLADARMKVSSRDQETSVESVACPSMHATNMIGPGRPVSVFASSPPCGHFAWALGVRFPTPIPRESMLQRAMRVVPISDGQPPAPGSGCRPAARATNQSEVAEQRQLLGRATRSSSATTCPAGRRANSRRFVNVLTSGG